MRGSSKKRTRRPSKCEIVGEAVQITAGTGEIAVVDIADFEAVSPFVWSRRFRGSGAPELFSTRLRLSLPRFLMRPVPGQYVDHRNGDTLDNRRGNLRLCSISENNRNSRNKGRLGFKGVKRSTARSWMAYGTQNGRQFYIGTFDSPTAAANAYDQYARVTYGEFACVNFPRGNERGALTADQVKMILNSHDSGVNTHAGR